MKRAEFWLTESSNGKLARNNKVKREVKSISSGQRELFLYRRKVSVKILLIMSLRFYFMVRKFDSSSTECYLRSDDMLHEGQKVSLRWYKGKSHVLVHVTKAYGGGDLWLYSFFRSALCRGNWSAALPRGKEPQIPIE
jgi:hypothetical protein